MRNALRVLRRPCLPNFGIWLIALNAVFDVVQTTINMLNGQPVSVYSSTSDVVGAAVAAVFTVTAYFLVVREAPSAARWTFVGMMASLFAGAIWSMHARPYSGYHVYTARDLITVVVFDLVLLLVILRFRLVRPVVRQPRL